MLEDKYVLIDISMTFRVDDTLVPIIFLSNGTHLSNFAGDKKEFPVYISIRNVSSKICQIGSTSGIVIIALLPFPIKNRKICQKWLDELRQTYRELLNKVLRRGLQGLTVKPKPSGQSEYYNVLCADGTLRRCKPVLAAWLAHCAVNSDIYYHERNISVWCECPQNKLGDFVPPVTQHPRWVHNLYRTLSNPNTKVADSELSSHHIYRWLNLFEHILGVVSDILKVDLLHTI